MSILLDCFTGICTRDQINAWYNAVGFIEKSDLVFTSQKQLVVPEYLSFQRKKNMCPTSISL